MKRSLIALLSAGMAVGTAWAQPAGRSAGTARTAAWDEQNRAMLYLIVHLSNINAANGLNLSREQAAKLEALARGIEAAAPKTPDLTAAYRPDLGEVRDTYVALRDKLLAGQELDDAFRARVTKARTLEASVIRMSLVKPGARSEGCMRCHQAPRAADVRQMKDDAHSKVVAEATRLPGLNREIFMAHQAGVLGKGGMVAVVFAAPKVDEILTTAQKAIVSDFTCCLVPPKDMGDPVRAGQAKSDEGHAKLLRYVRAVSPQAWPGTRPKLLEWADRLAIVYQPGIEEQQKDRARREVADIFERTRKLSETDFELEKDALAADLAKAAKFPGKLTANQRRYMTASFLLVPGSSEVYARLIKSRRAGNEAKKRLTILD